MSEQPNNDRCPACSKPLRVAHESNGETVKWIAWCANGHCLNETANQGGSGPTKQAAIDDVIAKTERDL